MKKWDWQLYLYTGNTVNKKTFFEYFPPNGSDEDWRIHYVEDEVSVLYELHVHLKNGIVESADTFKADVYGGHGRPIIDERSLASNEKKHALEIFDLCLINPYLSEVEEVINLAVERKATYQGYTIVSSGKNSVSYITSKGEKGTVAKKRIVDALKCAHLDLKMLRDVEFVQDFNSAFTKAPYEPLYAIIMCADPVKYDNYETLNSEYSFEKLEDAVREGDLIKSKQYESGLSKDTGAILKAAVYNGNIDVLKWVLSYNTSNADAINYAISYAANLNKFDIFDFLLSIVSVEGTKNKSAQDVMNTVAAKKDVSLVERMIKKGYPFTTWYAHDIYEKLTLDKIKEWLDYDVFLVPEVLSRIVSEERYDILEIVEKIPGKYVTTDMLMELYITQKDFSKFKTIIINYGLPTNIKLFSLAFNNGRKWTDLLIKYGFDINLNDGRLLHEACESLNSDLVIYLIENEADIYLRGEYSTSAFEKAAGFHGNCMNENQKMEKEIICKCFLELGVDLTEQTTKSSLSVLAYLFGDDSSVEFKKYIVDWLVSHDKINEPVGDGTHVPIDFLIGFRKDDEETILYMLENGANPSAAKKIKPRLFVEAVMCNYSRTVLEKLLESGANIDERDQLDRTALYHAMESGDLELVKWLVSKGCDVNCVCDIHKYSRNGGIPETPMDIGVKKNNLECVEYLLSCGAKKSSEI